MARPRPLGASAPSDSSPSCRRGAAGVDPPHGHLRPERHHLDWQQSRRAPVRPGQRGPFSGFVTTTAMSSSLSNDRVNSIHEAADGSIWIATQSGLDHWDANARPVRRYTPEDGLPGSTVSCILEDDVRQLWMSTDRGISRLDAATGQFTSYGTADGLPGVNMTGWDSCARAESGEMFFAGLRGGSGVLPSEGHRPGLRAARGAHALPAPRFDVRG